MSLISLIRVFALGLLVLALGCGEGSTPVEDPGLSTADLIEKDLENVAETGRMGSEMMSIEQNIEKLREEDPGKAEELSQDLEELKGLSGARAQSKAKEMQDKL